MCFALIVSAVLRWLAPAKERPKRLNQLAAFAAIILCFICLSAMWSTLGHMLEPGVDSGVEGSMAAASNVEAFIGVFSLITKLLLLGTVMASTTVLVLVIVLFLGHGLKAIFAAGTQETEPLKEELKDISKRLAAIMKSPILIAVITWGILALFITLPFLMGNSEKGDLAETWISGVDKIVSFGSESYEKTLGSDDLDQGTGESEESNPGQDFSSGQSEASEAENSGSDNAKRIFYQQLLKYILVTVIVLGVAFAVFKLLYSIISRTFTVEKAYDLIDEYSGAIGVLSVGVAMLWTLQGNVYVMDASGKLFLAFLKSFGMVMLIVALIILTLEVIRLLLDMREKLIRQEARFLFVALVGEISLLLLSAITSIYEAANHAMGNSNDSSLEGVLNLIKEKIVWTMKKHLPASKEYKRTFSGFSETVSKDDDEEDY